MKIYLSEFKNDKVKRIRAARWGWTALILLAIFVLCAAGFAYYWLNRATPESIRLYTLKKNFDTCPKSCVLYDEETNPYTEIKVKGKTKKIFLLKEGCPVRAKGRGK